LVSVVWTRAAVAAACGRRQRWADRRRSATTVTDLDDLWRDFNRKLGGLFAAGGARRPELEPGKFHFQPT
jgi:hypothetical protein